MGDDLVTVATYWSPTEAHLARNRLEEAGISATLADELMVAMNWDLTNAVRGIKIQVLRRDIERAEAVLSEPMGNEIASDEPEAVPEEERDGGREEGEWEESDSDAAPNDRQRLAERALRGAVLGLMFLPFQVWVFWLLLKVFISDEPLGSRHRVWALSAAAINLPC